MPFEIWLLSRPDCSHRFDLVNVNNRCNMYPVLLVITNNENVFLMQFECTIFLFNQTQFNGLSYSHYKHIYNYIYTDHGRLFVIYY